MHFPLCGLADSYHSFFISGDAAGLTVANYLMANVATTDNMVDVDDSIGFMVY